MKFRTAFQDSNVVFLPVAGNLQRLEANIFSQACYYGAKIKLTTGFFVNPDTEKVEKVLKVELLEDNPTLKSKMSEERETRRAEIWRRFLAGERQVEIAESLKVSKQLVNQEIKSLKQQNARKEI